LGDWAAKLIVVVAEGADWTTVLEVALLSVAGDSRAEGSAIEVQAPPTVAEPGMAKN